MNQNEIKHYGILGMKWGVRRNFKKIGSKTKNTLRVSKNNGTISRATNSIQNILRTKSKMSSKKFSSSKINEAKKMSNEELQKKIRRMQMEQEYARLSANDISSGKSHVHDILSIAGDTVILAGAVATAYKTYKSLDK